MKIRFISFIDNTESIIMYSKSNNVEIMSGYDTNNIINMLIDSFNKRYQKALETQMKGSNYVFDRINLLEYHFHKITLNRGSSYISTLSWYQIKNAQFISKTNKIICVLYML